MKCAVPLAEVVNSCRSLKRQPSEAILSNRVMRAFEEHLALKVDNLPLLRRLQGSNKRFIVLLNLPVPTLSVMRLVVQLICRQPSQISSSRIWLCLKFVNDDLGFGGSGEWWPYVLSWWTTIWPCIQVNYKRLFRDRGFRSGKNPSFLISRSTADKTHTNNII